MQTSPKEQEYSASQIASICDHTFLNPAEFYRSLAKSNESAIKLRQSAFFQFLKMTCESPLKPYGVCLRAEDVPHAIQYFDRQTDFKPILSAVVGFPDGSWYKSRYKFFQAQYALSEGAQEIDMPLNWQALHQGNNAAVLEEIQGICRLVHQAKGILKLILETSFLNERQIEQACQLAAYAGVDFIKTSSGYGTYGAQSESLKVILKHFKGGIKISGGVNQINVIPFIKLYAKERGEPGNIFDPLKIRIGESTLLHQLSALSSA